MNQTEYIIEQQEFIEHLKNSPTYLRMQELSSMIENDEKLVLLAKERDSSYEKGMNEPDEQKKREYLIRFKNLDDQFKDHELVREYLDCQKRIKKILSVINDEISKELRDI